MKTPESPEFDHDRLRECLEAAGLDGGFRRLTCEFIGRFSNDVWRLELDNGVRMIAKRPYRPPRGSDSADVEHHFYRFCHGHGLTAGVDLPVPRFIGELDGALLLEYQDLAPFSFEGSVSADHAEAAIDALADWHGFWWNRVPDEAWLPSYADPDLRRQIQQNYDAAWRVHRARLLEYAPEFESLGNALVGRLAATLAPMAAPATLIHGDAHAENLPMTDSGVLLLDWQDPRIANPGLDLAVFTTMSYLEADRRSAEQSLVMRHADKIREKGHQWKDPWHDYRLGLLRRAVAIVELAEIEFVSLPWVFRRSAMGAVDHDVGELIR
jgi:aminoglycoside phosphotransferase (APT) family kinase protein